jgi:hypothetical protein
LAALPASRDGQSPPAADVVRAFGATTSPISLHTLSSLLQHLERYESDLSEEMEDLTDSLVRLLQGDPGSCLPQPRAQPDHASPRARRDS